MNSKYWFLIINNYYEFQRIPKITMNSYELLWILNNYCGLFKNYYEFVMVHQDYNEFQIIHINSHELLRIHKDS